ncbi:MAG: acyl-CoA dehydrogenase family protein, partial [Anaerolineae bacterium]|nr:acyl-CoA dehydrogenase family protein [Anaerolineae bacterium]
MSINFEIPDFILQQTQMVQWVAESTMRPYARQLDENEHERPKEFAETIWPILRDQQKAALDKLKQAPEEGNGEKKSRPSTRILGLMLQVEMLAWGDTGIYLCLPSPALGGAAIEAVGTTEQKLRLLQRFAEGDKPVWGAMAITEPGAGSDNSSMATTAEFDEETNEWVLNGEKIFIT